MPIDPETETNLTQALNDREPGNFPASSEADHGDRGGSHVPVHSGDLISLLRSTGFRSRPGSDPTAALIRHCLPPYQDGDGMRRVPEHRPRPTDAAYARSLNALPEGRIHSRLATGRGGSDPQDPEPGCPEFSIRHFIYNLRYRGRRSALAPELTKALERHDLHPYQDIDGMWRVPPPERPRPTWTDADYARALNALPEGELPARPYVRRGGRSQVQDADNPEVSIYAFLHNLRYRGRKGPLSSELIEALERHRLPLYRAGNGKWRVQWVAGETT